jgi:ice-binding like protein
MIRPTFVLAAAMLMITACGDDTSSGLAPVSLGNAGNYAVLAKSTVTTTGTTAVVGNVGLSPAAASFITGFDLSAPAAAYTTSALVTGRLYASDYDVPTPANLTDAVSDMEAAYTDAAGRTLPDETELGAGNIQGMTLAPGLYKWGTGVSIPSAVTLSGGSNDVWIFQIAQDLTVGNGAIVTLAGGARARNVFWQVGGAATLGTTSNFKGIILSQTAVTFNTGAVIQGRALAQTAVTLDATAVTQP